MKRHKNLAPHFQLDDKNPITEAERNTRRRRTAAAAIVALAITGGMVAKGINVINDIKRPQAAIEKSIKDDERAKDHESRLDDAVALAKRYEFKLKAVDDTGEPVSTSELSNLDKQHPRRVVALSVGVSDKPEARALVAKYAHSKEIEQKSPDIIVKFDQPRPGEKYAKHMLPGNQLTYIKPAMPSGGEDSLDLTMLPAVDYPSGTTATVYARTHVEVTHPDDLSNGQATYTEAVDKLVFDGEWREHHVSTEALPEPELKSN